MHRIQKERNPGIAVGNPANWPGSAIEVLRDDVSSEVSSFDGEDWSPISQKSPRTPGRDQSDPSYFEDGPSHAEEDVMVTPPTPGSPFRPSGSHFYSSVRKQIMEEFEINDHLFD